MKFYLTAAFSLIVSSKLLAGPINDEYTAATIKENYFGIVGTQTTISPSSICGESLRSETSTPTDEESKSEDYIANRVIYHSYFVKCIEKAVWLGGLGYVSVDQEKMFCDRASFDIELADTISKLKAIKSPKSGKFAGRDLAQIIKTTETLKTLQVTSCARHAIRNGHPTKILKSKGLPLNSNEVSNIDDSSRVKGKESSSAPEARSNASSVPK